ncbi:2292_t:CDS:2 [Gigaspora rosea]|nr:2292_t:CDS:2 [Gigaspora rosea]
MLLKCPINEVVKHGSDSDSKVMTSEVGGVTKNGNNEERNELWIVDQLSANLPTTSATGRATHGYPRIALRRPD